MILKVSDSLRIERILGDRPFAEIGEPVLAVVAEDRLAVAGEFVHEFRWAPVAVYDTSDLSCRAVLRAGFPVHALAFHPTLPLVAVGAGSYDGGYFFKGELLLLDLDTGTAKSLFEHEFGRQVLGLEWLDDQELRVHLAPYDDWQDRDARVEGHVAVVRRQDWSRVAPASIESDELAGPRIPMPRPDNRAHAYAVVNRLSPGIEPQRNNVRAIEVLSDGRTVAALAGVAGECWLPSGELQWRVPDDNGPYSGGQDLVVTPDERSVWSGLVRPAWQDSPQSLIRLSLTDGARLAEISPRHPYALVRCDGRPAAASAGPAPLRSWLRIRRGRRIYVQEIERTSAPSFEWLSAADPLPATADDGLLVEPGELRRLFPYSWVPGETHFAGPGVEIADGSLVLAGTVHHGHGLQPGGAFVIRRDMTTGKTLWTFRTDCPAVDLDADYDAAYIAYRDGEIVALDLRDGSVRRRWRPRGVFATALTVAGADRLLVGTSDGRILDCRTN
jgi:hypothetical protein